MDEILTPQMAGFDDDEGVLAAEQKLAKNAKKVALMTLGTAAQKYMMESGRPAGDSDGHCRHHHGCVTRWSRRFCARRSWRRRRVKTAAARYIDMTRVFCNDAVERIEARAKNTLAGMAEGDELRTLLAALRRFTKMTPMNTIAARQRIADVMIEANKYVLLRHSQDCQLADCELHAFAI